MPDDAEYAHSLKVLELRSGASTIEADQAYRRLRALFAEDSMATTTLLHEDLSDARRKAIIAEIELAYRTVIAHMSLERERIQARSEESGASKMPEISRYTGGAMRQVREALGLSLEELERVTKVQAKYIKYIEEERYEHLPEEIFVRGYVASMARSLGLSKDRVLGDYMPGFKARRG